jgi:tripartite-type tricarboxylate transporter receptor subunit TctC
MLAATAAALAALSWVQALAQDYPTKPIRLIVARPPGGASDIIARVIMAKLTDRWGQQIVIDNRPGGNGILATNIVARARADGYTLLMADDAHPINPILARDLQYDLTRDFQSVSLVAQHIHVIVVNPAVPANTLQELVALAKPAPGKYRYSSAGVGSAQHLAALGFAIAANIELVHIPYKEGAINGVMSGEVSVFAPSLASVIGHIEAGRVRALTVTSDKRASLLPNLPTVKELRIPFEFYSWGAVLAPAGTPRAVVMKLQTEITSIVKSPEIQEKLGARMNLIGSTPETLSALIAADSARWAKVLKEIGAAAQ